MRDSIFSSSIRSFLLAFFGIMGLCLGVLAVVVFISALSVSSEGEPEISYTYTPKIEPNAKGVRKSLSKDAPVILKLNVNGIIGSKELSKETIHQQLIESRERYFKNDRVKAILLCIDSPGGSAMDSDTIYRLIKAYKETYKIPVYAYIDGLCASGGMYVAAAADKIYASDTSLIGSVGVILSSALNVSNLMEKLGIQSLTLYDGKGKDNLNPLRPWHKGEEDNLQNAVSYFYERFVDIITTNRPRLTKEKLINEYGAEVFPAPLAKEYGYIDENGSDIDQALKDLAEKIGIHDEYYQLVSFENKSWVSELFNGKFELLKGRLTHQLELNSSIPSELRGHYLYLYSPTP